MKAVLRRSAPLLSLCLTMVAAASTQAQMPPMFANPALELFNELNLSDVCDLSSAAPIPATGTNMPSQYQSLVARCRNNGNVVGYTTVQFTVSPSGLANLDGTNVMTDGRGKAYVHVIGAGTAADYESVVVKATWKDVYNRTVATRQTRVRLRTLLRSTSPTPWVGPQLNVPILYKDVGLTKMGPFAAASRNAWTYPGKVSFQATTGTPHYTFNEAYDRARLGAYAWTNKLARTVTYNMYALDGDYWANRGADPKLDKAFVKFELRHNLQNVATHEVGHVLGLGHSASLNALLYPDSKSIFIWGIITPTADNDWPNILSHY